MDEIIKYYNTLKNAYDSGELYFSNNSDRAHNAMIMRLMLEESNEICMYCGEMSIFRKGFYSHIEKQNPSVGKKIEKIMHDSLLNFLNKDHTSLKIILENYDESYFFDLIVPYETFKNKVQLSYLPKYIENKYQINHFSFSSDEKIVRMEINKDKHNAICKIENTIVNDGQPSPAKNFYELSRASKPVCLSA